MENNIEILVIVATDSVSRKICLSFPALAFLDTSLSIWKLGKRVLLTLLCWFWPYGPFQGAIAFKLSHFSVHALTNKNFPTSPQTFPLHLKLSHFSVHALTNNIQAFGDLNAVL